MKTNKIQFKPRQLPNVFKTILITVFKNKSDYATFRKNGRHLETYFMDMLHVGKTALNPDLLVW